MIFPNHRLARMFVMEKLARKGHIKHDMIITEDMKAAIELHGVVEGCSAAVVKVETGEKDNKIPGMSVLRNVQYEVSGIHVRKAYNIGSGRLIPYSDLGAVPQGETGLRVT